MTIRTSINASALNEAYDHFLRCAEDSPEGTYEEAKAITSLIGEVADKLLKDIKALGLKADNCDRIREVEAVIYGYLKDCNPEATVFAVSEGFGSAMNGPARDRVIAQASSNLAALRSLGAVQ